MMIIDPIIMPTTPVAEIREWLAELATMPQKEEAVIDETERAQDCLKWALAHEKRAAP